MTRRAVLAGIDLGGTASRALIWDGATVLASDTEPTASFAGTPAERAGRLAGMVTRLLPAETRLAGVGIGASGPLDSASGVIHNPDTLPQFSGFPLVAEMQRRLDVPVLLENDAAAAAVGEHAAGAGRGAARMLMVTLGTGIGATFLENGMPFRGANGMHPEAGHIPVSGEPERCYCGLTGCWEQYASRRALQRLLQRSCPDLSPGPGMLRTAAERAAHVPAVAEVFVEYGHRVGRGLAALQGLFMPEVTVVGGSAAEHLPLFGESLRRELPRPPGYTIASEIRPAELGDLAGAIGSAVLASRRSAA